MSTDPAPSAHPTDPLASTALGRAVWIGPLAVFVVAGVLLLGTTWHPVGDYAIAELVVRKAWNHPPLFGPYSADRPYRHPLPLVYLLCWPLYQLAGRRSSALLSSTVWFNGACVALVLWLALRRRALGLGLVVVAAITVFARGSAPGHLLIPWNPFLAFLPAVALVVAAWVAALGDRWALPVVAALALCAAGSHLGYGPTAVGLSLVAVVGLVTATVRRDGRAGLRSLLAPAGVSLLVVGVVAFPALLDLALSGNRSNLWRISHWLQTSKAHTVPSWMVRRATMGDLSLHATWATGRRAVEPFSVSPPTQFPVILAAAVVALVLGVVRRAADEVVAFVTVAVGLLATYLGLLNLESPRLVDWYLLPLHAMSLALTAVTVWSLCRSARHALGHRADVLDRVDPRRRLAAAAVVATLLAVAMVPTLHEEHATRDMHHAAVSLVPQIEQHVKRSDVILLKAPYRFDGYYSESLALELDRAGYTVRVPPWYGYLFFDAYTKVPHGRRVTTLQVELSDTATTRPSDDAQLLAVTPPGTPGLPNAQTRMAVWLIPGG